MKQIRKFFQRLHTAWRVMTCKHQFVVFFDNDIAEADVPRTTSVLAAGIYLNGECDHPEAYARLEAILRVFTLQDDLLLYWRDHTDGQYYAAWACESDGRLQELLSLTVDTETGDNKSL